LSSIQPISVTANQMMKPQLPHCRHAVGQTVAEAVLGRGDLVIAQFEIGRHDMAQHMLLILIQIAKGAAQQLFRQGFGRIAKLHGPPVLSYASSAWAISARLFSSP
jgi:hypothetical protein